MSLKGAGLAKLGIAHSNAEDRESEPGADAGFFGRQPGVGLPRRGASRNLRLGGADVEVVPARLAAQDPAIRRVR